LSGRVRGIGKELLDRALEDADRASLELNPFQAAFPEPAINSGPGDGQHIGHQAGPQEQVVGHGGKDEAKGREYQEHMAKERGPGGPRRLTGLIKKALSEKHGAEGYGAIGTFGAQVHPPGAAALAARDRAGLHLRKKGAGDDRLFLETHKLVLHLG